MDDAPRYRWVVIGLFWTFNAAASMGSLSLVMMLPDMRRDLAATPMQLGWLSSLAWLVPAATSLVLGTWVSRLSPKLAIGLSMFFSGVFLFMQGWAPSYPLEFIARVGYMVAMMFRMPAGALLIQQWFALRDITRINGLGTTTMAIGQMAALGLAPVLVYALSGWRPTFYLLGFLHFLLTAVWLVLGRDRRTPEYRARELQQRATPLLALTKYRSLWVVASCQTGSALAFAAFLTFMPSFLTEVRGVSLAMAGSLMALLSLGCIVGSFASGFLAERLGLHKPIIWTAGLGLLTCYLAMTSIPSLPIVALLLFTTGYFAFVVVPLIHAIPYHLPGITPREVAIGLSLLATLTPLGASLGPLLAGYLQESTGSLQFALTVCGLGSISLTVLGLLLPETGRRARPKPAPAASVGQFSVGGR